MPGISELSAINQGENTGTMAMSARGRCDRPSGRVAARLLSVCLVAAFFVVSLTVAFFHPPHEDFKLLVAQYVLLLPALLIWLWNAEPSNMPPIRTPNLAILSALFLILALGIATWIRLPTTGDESSYRFQARLLVSSRLTTEAPPATVPITFNHHSMTSGKWYSKYPPGWPLILAVGTRAGFDWAVNALMGLVILGITYGIGREVFGPPIGRLAVVLMILSPFFVLHCTGFFSHPSCGVFIAGATYGAIAALRSPSIWAAVASFACLAAAFMVRPFTAFCAGMVLGFWLLWNLRSNPRRIAAIVGIASVAGIAALGLSISYNRALTGIDSVLMYGEAAAHLALNAQGVLEGLNSTRSSLQSTLLYAFPFAFLIAGYAVMRERQHRSEVLLLISIFIALVIAHVVETWHIGPRYGERYYLEAYFAVAIVAARGLYLLRDRFPHIGRRDLLAASCVLFFVQVFYFATGVEDALAKVRPWNHIQTALNQIEVTNAVAFIRVNGAQLTARDFNVNAPDWRSARLFVMEDVGTTTRRASVACSLDRTAWVLIGYDEQSDTVQRVEEHEANCNPMLDS